MKSTCAVYNYGPSFQNQVWALLFGWEWGFILKVPSDPGSQEHKSCWLSSDGSLKDGGPEESGRLDQGHKFQYPPPPLKNMLGSGKQKNKGFVFFPKGICCFQTGQIGQLNENSQRMALSTSRGLRNARTIINQQQVAHKFSLCSRKQLKIKHCNFQRKKQQRRAWEKEK